MRFPSLPIVTGSASMLGSVSAFAQGTAHVVAGPAPDLMAFLTPILPAITSALLFGGGALAAWVVKTFLGMSIKAFVTFLRAVAKSEVDKAKKTKTPDDDGPAAVKSQILNSVADSLEQSEKTIPFKGE